MIKTTNIRVELITQGAGLSRRVIGRRVIGRRAIRA